MGEGSGEVASSDAAPGPARPGGASFAALPALYVVHFAALGILLPYLPVWLVAHEVRGVALGVALAVPALVGVVAPIVLGALADALGLRARMLTLAAAVALVASVGLAFAATALEPTSRALPVALALGISVIAFARVPLFGLTDVLALEALGDDRARFGALRLFGSLGFLATAVAFPIFFDPGSSVALPLVVAASYAATLLVARALPPTRAPLGLDVPAIGRMFARNAGFFLALLLWQLGNASYDALFTLHLAEVGVPRAWLGAAWGIGVIAEVALMACTAALLRRWSAERLLLAGLLIAAARWALLSELRAPGLILVAQLLHAGSFALTWTIANVELPRVAAGGRLATAQGALASCVAVGSALGMLAWPAVHEAHGARWAFLGGAAVAALGAVVLVIGRGARPNTEERPLRTPQ